MSFNSPLNAWTESTSIQRLLQQEYAAKCLVLVRIYKLEARIEEAVVGLTLILLRLCTLSLEAGARCLSFPTSAEERCCLTGTTLLETNLEQDTL